MKTIKDFYQRIPFTLLTMAGLFIVALVTNTYIEQITHHWLNRTGFAANDLWYWRVERLFTSALVTTGGVVFWEALFFVASVVGLAEWMTGWRRTATTFWGVHLLALILLSVVMSLAAHQLRNIGLEASELERDVGPSAGYFACLGLVSAMLKRPWNLVSGSILLLVFVAILFTPAAIGESAKLKLSADLAHLLAFPLGWLFGWFGSRSGLELL
jgi:hypothetical protein